MGVARRLMRVVRTKWAWTVAALGSGFTLLCLSASLGEISTARAQDIETLLLTCVEASTSAESSPAEYRLISTHASGSAPAGLPMDARQRGAAITPCLGALVQLFDLGWELLYVGPGTPPGTYLLRNTGASTTPAGAMALYLGCAEIRASDSGATEYLVTQAYQTDGSPLLPPTDPRLRDPRVARMPCLEVLASLLNQGYELIHIVEGNPAAGYLLRRMW